MVREPAACAGVDTLSPHFSAKVTFMRSALTVIALAATLAACTQRADSIGAIPVSPEEFAGANCETLLSQYEDENAKLKDLSQEQDSEIVGDVRMFGASLGSMSEDQNIKNQETAIAYAKGRVNALDIAMRRKNCAM
ncbi:hypothetical protein K7H91_19730 [Martelella mediterranea]|uniref:hypothetical protein n=1 Tax=Martelella mediterranea TaxID=293089 RepID=UPI001E43E027|nr:hypothetical protein [Martelella mediterranea]MCD1635994.1 hypothetical protein [Martelella mediterranea]